MLALTIILGAVFGSFANACIHRIPRKESIAYPPSHCPKCNHLLSPLDLIPILSFILLRGKCRYCQNSISLRYLIVEIAMAVSFGVLWVISEHPILFLWYALHFFILFTLSIIDMEHMILPNNLIISGTIFAIMPSIFGIGLPISSALIGGVVGFSILFIISILSGGKMGGGDIKLMTYLGLLIGPINVFFALFIGALLGVLIHVPSSLILKKKLYGQAIPFGPYLALAGFINIFLGDEILSLWLSMTTF